MSSSKSSSETATSASNRSTPCRQTPRRPSNRPLAPHAFAHARDLVQVKPLSTLFEPYGIVGRVALAEFVSHASNAAYGIGGSPADKGAAEPSDLLIDSAHIEEDAMGPELLDEALSRKDRSRCRNQERQQFELDLTQANEPTGAVHRVAGWIDLNAAYADG